ncbi:phosphate ABC transporter substrate-binding/OmpA family protein [Ruegeria sp. SCPT10]|uniref:phosphate ABC transporter substrate-binding/OmpA family protein n=1 Tax=Ruegeria sp. SCP10 TaxID=3141377 RepID=UPI003335A2AC
MLNSPFTRLCVAASIISGAVTTASFAQEVRLIGKDSNIDVIGNLLSSKDGKYLVETDIGEFVINQDLVTCEGEACPTEQTYVYDLEISAPDEIAEVLVPIIAEGYAAAALEAEAQLYDENGEPVDTETVDVGDHKYGEEHDFALLLTDLEGDDVATFGIHTANGARLFERLAKKDASIIFTETSARKADRSIVSESSGGNLRDFDQERVIAVDGFAMIVNPLNQIPDLSVKQARDIMSGDITNWSEVGGSDAPIHVYSFDPDTEAYHHIEKLLFKKSDKTLTNESSIVHDRTELTTAIMEDVAGFGIVNYAAKRDARAVPLRTTCGIVQDPSLFNLKTEEYYLQERVVAYNRSDIDGYARELVDFLDDGSLDGLVAKAGYIDLSITSDSQERAAERLVAELEEGENEYEAELVEDLLKNMNTHARLSTTFRFAPGSKRFDNKAERDLTRMVRYLAETKPSEVVIVGFTDNKGPFDSNLLISQERAQAALDHLVEVATGGELDGITLKAAGYGELEPVACNDSPRGRAINRRVEVWIAG